MATMTGGAGEKVFSIRKFLGLNESPDGDAKLKLGEASEMLNWQVTREGSLKRRPGNEQLCGLCTDNSYQAAIENDAETICTIAEATEMVLSPNLILSTGMPALSDNGKVTTTAASAPSYLNYFWRENTQRTWKLTAAATDDGKVTLKGKRVRANSSSSKPPVRCLWSGLIGGKATMLGACDGRLFRLINPDTGTPERTQLGAVSTDYFTHVFGFDGKAYILDGLNYYVYDGSTLGSVGGYVPLVAITITPDGQYETAEQINKLTASRRGWLSPDGEHVTFQLPEKDLQSVDYVTVLSTGTALTANSDYTYNLANGTVTFNVSPAQGVNTFEVGWTTKVSFRTDVCQMRFSELYSGSQDNRVFLYGYYMKQTTDKDMRATAIYSGLDYNGKPRADYFPDLGEVRVGDQNTPITSMIRHFGNLICFKSDSAWSLQYGITTLSDESLTPGFYVTPINRAIGNAALGQVQLVDNAPVTLHGQELYQWRSTSYYNASLSADERQAKRISDRISRTLSSFALAGCYCFDDNYHQEYYLCYGDKALVWHYAADAWSVYDGLGAVCMAAFGGSLYYGTADGRLERLDESLDTADGDAIDCYWESGSTDFGEAFRRKHSALLWLGVKPTANSSVTVTIQTDRKETFTEKAVDADNVRNPGTREPYMKRLKLKAKKFLYYKLMLKSKDRDARPTVTGADIRVRFTGYAK